MSIICFQSFLSDFMLLQRIMRHFTCKAFVDSVMSAAVKRRTGLQHGAKLITVTQTLPDSSQNTDLSISHKTQIIKVILQVCDQNSFQPFASFQWSSDTKWFWASESCDEAALTQSGHYDETHLNYLVKGLWSEPQLVTGKGELRLQLIYLWCSPLGSDCFRNADDQHSKQSLNASNTQWWAANANANANIASADCDQKCTVYYLSETRLLSGSDTNQQSAITLCNQHWRWCLVILTLQSSRRFCC